MSRFGPSASSLALSVPTPPQGEPIGHYATYLQAQRAVDYLSDNHFAVQFVTIVGTGLQMVERVTGRRTYPKVALAGLLSGAWFGVFVGTVIILFGSGDGRTLIAVIVLGSAFGVLQGVLAYAMTGGRRDFTSTSQIVATDYVVLCLAEKAGEARRMLAGLPGGTGRDLGGFEPSAPASWQPPVGSGTPVSPYGPPPAAHERADGAVAPLASQAGQAPSTSEVAPDVAGPPMVPSGPTYGEVMAQRRLEEKAAADKATAERTESARAAALKAQAARAQNVRAEAARTDHAEPEAGDLGGEG